jgi:serine/threonine protein kinase
MGSLHDAYELGGVAGHGRGTVVRLGVRRGDASPVALKQLRIDHAQDPDKRRRFVQQARRACMLQHESIETMIDVVDGSDGPVAVAEWIDGRSLERLASRRRRNDEAWSAEEVVLIARSMLEALRYAHHQPTAFEAQGMLHGGLWPGNVLVDVDGNVKLVDFGLASVWQDAPEPWQDLESLRYLSAEHVRHGATAASDLFAVGAVVHELLSGQRFRSEHQTESEMRLAIDRAEPPERPREDVPPPLERLRRRLLEPVQSPRLTLEHMLDLCVALSVGDARARLRALVRDTLRNDSTAPEPDTPPRGSSRRMVGPELQAEGSVAKTRARTSAAVHMAAGGGGRGLGIALQQVPLGQSARKPRGRDTQPVPIPVNHEQTAARRPMFLQQTAPPRGEAVARAERERSGSGKGSKRDDDWGSELIGERKSPGAATARSDDDEALSGDPWGSAPAVPMGSWDEVDDEPAEGDRHEGAPRRLSPQEVADVDTAPLPVGDPEVAVPEPIEEPEDEPEPLVELGVTAELPKIPLPPDDREDDTTILPIDPPPAGRAWRWLQGPVGWALLGAAVVGIGLPLAARCSAPDEPPPPARTSRR